MTDQPGYQFGLDQKEDAQVIQRQIDDTIFNAMDCGADQFMVGFCMFHRGLRLVHGLTSTKAVIAMLEKATADVRAGAYDSHVVSGGDTLQ